MLSRSDRKRCKAYIIDFTRQGRFGVLSYEADQVWGGTIPRVGWVWGKRVIWQGSFEERYVPLVRIERGIWDEDHLHSSTERNDPLGLHIVSTSLTHTSPKYKSTPQLC